MLVAACEQPQAWHKDYEAGIAEASRLSRPALVYFDAPWCSWCQAYKQDTLADPRLRKLLAKQFVSIVVDFDARPDLVARYRVRGLPYTLVLAPDGRVRNGFVGNLTAVDLIDVLQASVATSTLPLAPVEIVARVTALERPAFLHFQQSFLQHLEQLYSAEHGTLLGRFDTGGTLKRPSPISWLYLMEQRVWPARVASALAAERERLLDQVDGGFFNFLDPSRVTEDYLETSKLLESNAWLTVWFARAAKSDRRYREVAGNGYDWLLRVLWDPKHGGFFQAQVADQRYYALSPAARRTAAPPALDRIKRADTNAQAAWALIEYARAANEPAAIDYAERTIDFILQEFYREGRMHHSVRDDRLSAISPMLDTLWLLAAGAQLQPLRANDARDTVLTALAQRTALELDAHIRRSDRDTLSIEEAGLLAWVAVQRRYTQTFSPAILPWALKQLRIEIDTPPDELVHGLQAWERLISKAPVTAAPATR